MPRFILTHRRAVVLMMLVALMWSTAGLVSRHLESARSFEVTFWRSFFYLAVLTCYFAVVQGLGGFWADAQRRQGIVVVGLMLERDVHRLHGGADADHGS